VEIPPKDAGGLAHWLPHRQGGVVVNRMYRILMTGSDAVSLYCARRAETAEASLRNWAETQIFNRPTPPVGFQPHPTSSFLHFAIGFLQLPLFIPQTTIFTAVQAPLVNFLLRSSLLIASWFLGY
jgi:hypothetical protein